MACKNDKKPDDQLKRCQLDLENPWLHADQPDFLYHLGLGTETHNLPGLFGDVKFVCMGGTVSRMRHFAELLAKKLKTNEDVQDLTGHAGRYSMFKVGPVLSVNHGIGCPSLLILLHEILKLLHHAKCTDVIFFRIGTSGGIGLEPGSVVVTESAVDELLNRSCEMRSLGRRVERPCSFDPQLVNQLLDLGQQQQFPVVKGTTLCTGDFYEGQGRLDGAFCDFTSEEKMEYLFKLQEAGVKNIEMECLLFGSVLHRAGVIGAVVNVTLLDRLQGDQVVVKQTEYQDWLERPQQLITTFILHAMQN